MNGWTNRETWLVNLWISEGEIGDPQEVDEQARYFAERNDEHAATRKMAEWLEEQVREISCGHISGGLAGDLIGAAIAAVNWEEIAEHYVADQIKLEEELTANANA